MSTVHLLILDQYVSRWGRGQATLLGAQPLVVAVANFNVLSFQARHLPAHSVEWTSTSVAQEVSVCWDHIIVTVNRIVTINPTRSDVVRTCTSFYLPIVTHIIFVIFKSYSVSVTVPFSACDPFVRTNRRVIAMTFVCLSGTGVHCDHTVHFGADLSFWLDNLMFWSPLTPKHFYLLSAVFFQFHLEERWV